MSSPSESLAFESPEPGRVALAGALTFSTVEQLNDATPRLLLAQKDGRIEVDLAGVTRADSAGLALLIGWLAAARAARVSIGFRGVPERLRAIARISEVDGLLVAQAAPV